MLAVESFEFRQSSLAREDSNAKDTAQDVRQGMADHARPKILQPYRNQAVESAETGDLHAGRHALIGMGDAEQHCRQQERESAMSGPRLELPLEVAAKDELLAEPGA